MVKVSHGGRLDKAVEQYGGAPEKWLDLSTGINPNPIALPEIPAESWTRLPDRNAWKAAVQAVRAAYGAADDVPVSLAPGTQMHIQNLPFLFKPQPVAIVGFTYQEHGVCWSRAGHDVYMADGLESAEAIARIVIVVNPNNPDGRIVDRAELINLSRRLGPKGGLLVVDESFADVTGNASVAQEAGREGLLVLRSLGKFYGLAGLRFGAALGSPLLIPRLEERLGPWAVSGPALHVAQAVLGNEGWRKKTLKKLMAARERLEEILVANKCDVVGGTGLFVLASHAKAEELHSHLARRQILTRAFPGKPEWLRFGLPPNKAGFTRLDKALAEFYGKD